jgi:hypothetical protein
MKRLESFQNIIAALGLCGFIALGASAQQAGIPAIEETPATFTVINVPGAGTAANEGTLGESINASGVIAGNYWDTNDVTHGYVRAANGTITTFNAPEAGTSALQGTGGCYGINAAGDIAANYIDANFTFHGLLRAVSGKLYAFSAPGAGTGADQGTFPYSINASGTVSGYYIDSSNV